MDKNLIDQINIDDIIDIARTAGDKILSIYNDSFSVNYKDDNSPLTEADLVSNSIITNALKCYQLPILSEEGKEIKYKERCKWKYYWCVDPIDGTKEFIKKNNEFTVNIALIHKTVPVLGVVFAPAIGDIYYAKKGSGAFKNKKKISHLKNNFSNKEIKVVVSNSHLTNETQKFIDKFRDSSKKMVLLSKGSSLKLCMVAEGIADIYPRLAPTMEWDTAAADAIVRESGCMSYQLSNLKPLAYNKPDLHNPWFVVKNRAIEI
jgi:3'(2'), 5'-bisphosphate nucleotidase